MANAQYHLRVSSTKQAILEFTSATLGAAQTAAQSFATILGVNVDLVPIRLGTSTETAGVRDKHSYTAAAQGGSVDAPAGIAFP